MRIKLVFIDDGYSLNSDSDVKLYLLHWFKENWESLYRSGTVYSK